jgi:hypothetical protein
MSKKAAVKEPPKEDKTYNGWTNYETWNVKLWMDNDEGSYRYWRDVAKEALRDAEPVYAGQSTKDAATGAVMLRLESEIKDGKPDMEPSMYSDILGAALGDVNFYEIAESLINNAQEG